jgi:BlaI family transcriptional regulator, penicillinase repressor
MARATGVRKARSPMIRAKSKSTLPTPAELRLLDVLWRLGEATIEDVLAAYSENPPNYKTVQTLLRIMEGKKLISHRLRGRAFVYEPRVEKEQVNRMSIASFIERYFRGSRTELLLNLLDDDQCDDEELHQLEEMIQKQKKARQSK